MLQERELWLRYRRGDQVAGNVLAAKYLPAARRLAAQFASGRPVDWQSAFSGALLGLAEALHKYDPDRGYKFSALAQQVITGRIRDEARSEDRLARRHRLAIRQAQRAAELLAHELGHQPTREELTAAGVDLVDAPKIESIDADPFDGPRARARRNPSAFEEITGLTARERDLLVLRFVCGLDQAEIAERFGVSRSAVSQSLLRLLARLRTRGERIREALSS